MLKMKEKLIVLMTATIRLAQVTKPTMFHLSRRFGRLGEIIWMEARRDTYHFVVMPVRFKGIRSQQEPRHPICYMLLNPAQPCDLIVLGASRGQVRAQMY